MTLTQDSNLELRIAKILRAGRKCQVAPGFPCPFCYWSPDDLTPMFDETGCVWLAREVIKELNNGNQG